MNKVIYTNDRFAILDVSTSTYPNKITLVDIEDLKRISLYHWSIKAKNNALYVYSHIDGNTLINSKINLRICTKKDNLRNVTSFNQRNGKYKGVRKLRKGGGYSARIKFNGKGIHLGTYVTEALAAHAYNKAAIALFGEFAKLNNVD